MVFGESLGTPKARIMYNSYHSVGFADLARLGHWMFGLGILILVKEEEISVNCANWIRLSGILII